MPLLEVVEWKQPRYLKNHSRGTLLLDNGSRKQLRGRYHGVIRSNLAASFDLSLQCARGGLIERRNGRDSS